MKNTIFVVLFLAVVVCGGLFFQQSHKAKEHAAATQALEQQNSLLQSNVAAQQARAESLRQDLKETRLEAAARIQEAVDYQKSQKSNAAGGSGSTNAKAANPLGQMISEAMKNPEMKEMIKNQQKAVMGTMMEKNYAQLFAQLHLSPEQSSGLKDLLLEKQLGAVDAGMSMFSEDTDATKRAELVQEIKASSDAADARIKQFLGEDNYAQLQTYEKSLGERTLVNGFKDQLGSGANTLNGQQEQELVDAMSQERQSFKFTTDFSDKSKFNGDMASMFTEEKISTYFEETERLNQKYLARAQGILSAEQLSSYEKYLTSQQAMQKMGMKMASQMFGSPKAK